LAGLHTIIRDHSTSNEDFVFYSNRLIRLLVEEGLRLPRRLSSMPSPPHLIQIFSHRSHLPFAEKVITTPTGDSYRGVEWPSRLCGVSVVRAGGTAPFANNY
jgi:uridine kinase